MRLVRPPYAVRKLYSSMVWRMPADQKKIYLTFDDGPIPEVTPWVLDILKQFNAKATFFCVGENVVKHSEIFLRILNEGHAIGNHTYHHLNGWKTRNNKYFENIEKYSTVINSMLPATFSKKILFRPPYGKIKQSQVSNLKSQYSLIMWDVLSYDYDKSVSPEKCLANVMRFARSGSIIVFHDNVKALKNLQYALPKVLDQLSKNGFEFDAIEM